MLKLERNLVDRLNTPQIEILGQKSIQTKKFLNRVVEVTMTPPKIFYFTTHSLEYTLHNNKKGDHTLYGCNVPCGLETSREADGSINVKSSDQDFSDIGREPFTPENSFYLSTPLSVSIL